MPWEIGVNRDLHHTPYCSASPRFRCHACGDIVCNCMCTVECKCGKKLSRWSWRYDLDWQRARFDVCCCGRERPRVGFDWVRFDLPSWPTKYALEQV